jgi:hypothetical protein
MTPNTAKIGVSRGKIQRFCRVKIGINWLASDNLLLLAQFPAL